MILVHLGRRKIHIVSVCSIPKTAHGAASHSKGPSRDYGHIHVRDYAYPDKVNVL
jgi:hypothetical protein